MITKKYIKENTYTKKLNNTFNAYKHVFKTHNKRFECSPEHNNLILVQVKDSDVAEQLGPAMNKEEFVNDVYDYLYGN